MQVGFSGLLILVFLHLSFLVNLSSEESEKFVILSIPKCGSHLIVKAVQLLTQKPVIDSGFDPRHDFNAYLHRHQHSIIKLFNAHSPHLENTLIKNNYKWILMVRDPRDAVVSLVAYIDRIPGNPKDFFSASDAFDQLSFPKKINAVLFGSRCDNYPHRFYKPMVRWANSARALVVRFEDLVGSKGGGDDQLQLYTLRRICDHIGLNVSDSALLEVADCLYEQEPAQMVKGKPYVHAQIRNWRMFLTPYQEHLCAAIFAEEMVKFEYIR